MLAVSWAIPPFRTVADLLGRREYDAKFSRLAR
jgi:hypothetical protein